VKQVTTRAALAAAVADARAAGKRIAFVPTMGYLHEGHLSLCDVAAAGSGAQGDAAFVVMSIFVNPLQFGPGEDFDRYPRDLDRDAALAAARGVDLLFAPDVHEMYPHGATRVFVTADALETRLCGAYRPGHFRGVLTVVAKLFHMVAPDVAVFGQKDLQQSVLIRRMVRDLDFPVDVVVAPITREADGLAMSSRNVYLTNEERAAAPVLHRALEAARAAFAGNAAATATQILTTARTVIAGEPLVKLQYLALVDADTLDDVEHPVAGNAIAIAAYLGRTRLIDNLVL
jgi:pantoate--beta-alanine ligase